MFLLVLLLLLILIPSDGFGLGLTPSCWHSCHGYTSNRSSLVVLVRVPEREGPRVKLGATRRSGGNTDSQISRNGRSKNTAVSVDDAIAAMGLTQVKKQSKTKGDNNANKSTSTSTSTTASKNNNHNKKLDARHSVADGTKNRAERRASTNTSSMNTDEKKKQHEKSGKNAKTTKTSLSTRRNASPESASASLQLAKDISLQIQLEYARDGHASIRNLIPPDVIQEVYQDLKAYSADQKNRKKAEDTAPFLQFYNTWRDIPSVKRLVTSPLLCQAACTILNLPISDTGSSDLKLRLYQDSVFIKRKNKDGITPWHIDGRMMPFDSSNVITFWIPLHSIPSIDDGGTGLLFINKSHSDFSLPYWNGRGTEYDADDDDGDPTGYNAYDSLTTRYGIQNVGDDRIIDNNPGVVGHHMPLDPGDCTIHNGWTMHCANGNKKNKNKNKNTESASSFQTRYAIAVSYVDSHAEVREDVSGVGKNIMVQGKDKRRPNSRSMPFLGDSEDSASYVEWIGDVQPRTRFQHELTPDVWPSPKK